jgi:hypothetical protein
MTISKQMMVKRKKRRRMDKLTILILASRMLSDYPNFILTNLKKRFIYLSILFNY